MEKNKARKRKDDRLGQWSGKRTLRGICLSKGLKEMRRQAMQSPGFTGGRSRECKGPGVDVYSWFSTVSGIRVS